MRKIESYRQTGMQTDRRRVYLVRMALMVSKR